VNEPAVREASFNSSPIELDDHRAWFAARLASPDCAIFIAEDEAAEPVGVIRFDCDGGEAVVSITVAQARRGRGYAHAIISAGCRALADERDVERFVAETRPEHHASQRAFTKAGFELVGSFSKDGRPAVRMEARP
jgi:RimJ/RimL family protein N-acetyltransferase